MSWTNLPTDYADATWTGDRKYTINLGGGGTYSDSTITDETSYSPATSGGNYFYGANDANQTNDAINKIVSALGNDINNLKVNIANGGTGATTASAARTNLEVMKATTLYQNDSGTSGTITLSETSANFDYIEVYYKTDGDSLTSQKIYSPNGKSAFLYVSTAYSPTNTVMMFMGVIVFSGTSVTWVSNNDAFFAVNTSKVHTFNFQRGLNIYKIVGFSY